MCPPRLALGVILLILPLISPSLSIPAFEFDPARFTRSSSPSQLEEPAHPDAALVMNATLSDGAGQEDIDMSSWLRRHSIKVGNSSDFDLKAILASIMQMERTESINYPRIKVYNYDFGKGNVKELLVYSDPDEEKQWVVNIDRLDMRQNLIVFPLGDLGFGFRKEQTFVVLRKSKSKANPSHYMHLAYFIKVKKSKNGPEMRVEWDNIRPQDFLPIPITLQEPSEDHENHCQPRNCGMQEYIFGTCPIIKLTCSVLNSLPISGGNKERMDSLIREKQPFIYELARTLVIHKRDLKLASRGRGMGGFAGGMGRNLDLEDEYAEEEDYEDEDNLFEKNNDGRWSVSHRARRTQGGDSHLHPRNIHDDHHSIRKKDSVAEASRKADRFKKAVLARNAPAEQNEKDSQSTVAEDEEEKEDKAGDDPPKVGSGEKDDEPSEKSSTDENVPSSLDLLNLKNDSDSSPADIPPGKPQLQLVNTNNYSYFEKILMKIRKGPPAKYTVRPLECVRCEKLGTFFNDYQDSILLSYVANNIVAGIFHNSSLRKTVFSPRASDVLRQHPTIPYIGYGRCNYSVNVLSHPPPSTELDDLIDYYSESLGVNCHQKLGCNMQATRTKMREMLTSNFHMLEVWPDMSIRFNKSSTVAQNQILSTNEFKEFMLALIFAAYTTEYRMHASHYNINNDNNPDLANRHQSLRMKFQTRVILRVVDELIKNFQQHLVKGLRHLLQLLRDKYSALVAESLGISAYEFDGRYQNNSVFKATNKNDRLQIIGLKDFIINGVAPIMRSGAGSFPSFITYFNRNYRRIKNSFVEYGIERPPQVKGGRNQVRSADGELDKVFQQMAEGATEDEAEVAEEEEDGEGKSGKKKKRFVKVTRY